jgi:hypothetical protein
MDLAERKISFTLYAIAFIIAAALFSIGVYVGTIINNNAVGSIGSNVGTLNQRLSTMEVLLLMEENNTAFCPVYKSELVEIDKQREKLGYELTLLEQKQVYAPDTKKDYMMLQAQSYLLAKKINGLCPDEKNSVVLFFYTNMGCDSCTQQGNVILEARDSAKNSNDVKIYALDAGIGSPVVDAFRTQYKVTSYPTIIVNGVTYHGLTNGDLISRAMENVTGN